MKIIIKNKRIDVYKFSNLVNKIVNEYNINVKMVEEPSMKKQVISVYPELIESVKYSPLFSQFYDERRLAVAEQTGELERNPKMKFGIKMKYLHWYHWALLNDVITYILDKLGADYEIRTAVGRYKGWQEWRHQINLDYYPQFDPAFNKRNARVIKRFKGVPIYADREKMLKALDEVDTAIESGILSPADLPKLEEEILQFTRASHYYEGLTVPETLREEKPHYRAWLILKHGDDAYTIYQYMAETKKNEEYENLEKWLARADPKSDLFKKYLKIWKDEVTLDIEWAIDHYGPYEEILRDKDDAGFPYALAKSLRTKPFEPKIEPQELKKLLKEEEKESVIA